MINGHSPDTADALASEHIKLAQKRLAEACMKLPLNPNNAGISAFVNGALLNAKVNALVEYTAPFELGADGQPIMKGTFEEILLKMLERDAVQLENAIREQPRIAVAQTVGGTH